MTVSLRVLGPVRAEIDGEPVDVGGPARRAVLARLAVAGGQVVAAERLAEDLSEGRPRALAALQVHVSHLRRALEPDRPPRAPSSVLVTAAPGYALRLADPDRLDATRVERLLDRARDEAPPAAAATLRRALADWRGPAYAEFADEPWARAEAARLDELALVARERLAAAELELGAHAEVVAALERHVREHPLREEGVRLLATALARSGRAPDALELLRRTRAELREELGLDPGPELAALEAAVLRPGGDTGPAPTPPPPAPRPPAPRPPAPAPTADRPLGRAAEIARLGRAAERVAARGVEVVLVSGEAGSGKTTLVDDLVADRLAAGWTVVRGRCPEVDGAPPAWPWTEILRDLDGSPTAEPAGPDEPTPFARGRAVVDALARRDGPVLITLDDLHRADDETLRLLRMVVTEAQTEAGGGLLVVATQRPEEDTAALVATWAALAASVGDRILLGGLDAAAVGALMARHGMHADATVADTVATRTGGNPLFVREVTRLALTGEPGADGRTVPAGVRDVLRRRLRDLPGRSRAMLAHVALLGRRADVETVTAVDAAIERRALGEVEEDVLDGLEAAVAAGVLVEEDGGRAVAFTHDLWREVVHDDVPRLRRARRHALVLDVLEAAGADPAVLAQHALAGEDRVAPDRALAHLVAAADRARDRGAYRTAVGRSEQARDLAIRTGAAPREVVVLRARVAAALALSGATVPAVLERDVALGEATALADPALQAAVIASIDAPFPWPERLHQGAVASTIEALLAPDRTDGWAPDEALRVRLLVALFLDVEFADMDRATGIAAEALERARALGEPRLRALALNATFFSCDRPSRWDRLAAIGAEMLAAADEGDHADFRAQAHYVRFVAALARDDRAGAREALGRAIGCATDGQLETTLSYAELYQATTAVAEGRLDDAERIYQEETGRLEAAGSPLAAPLREVALFTVRRARGDATGSVAGLEWLDALFGGYVRDFLVDALLDAGRVEEARELWASRGPVPPDWSWLTALTARASCAVRLGDEEAAAWCRAELAPYAGRLATSVGGAFTGGPVDLTLAVLDRVLGGPVPERRARLERALALVAPDHPWARLATAELAALPGSPAP